MYVHLSSSSAAGSVIAAMGAFMPQDTCFPRGRRSAPAVNRRIRQRRDPSSEGTPVQAIDYQIPTPITVNRDSVIDGSPQPRLASALHGHLAALQAKATLLAPRVIADERWLVAGFLGADMPSPKVYLAIAADHRARQRRLLAMTARLLEEASLAPIA